MKTKTSRSLAAGILGAVLSSTFAVAQDGPSFPAPRLANGVVPQSAYEPVREKMVVANPTPIFSDITPYSTPTGELDTVGQPLNAIARVKEWDWYLVGLNGVGIGYVSRGVLAPAARFKSPVAKS